MKHRISKTSLIVSIFAITLFGLNTTVLADGMGNYFNAPKNVQELNARFGAPVKIIEMDNGIKKMFYGQKTSYTDYLYYLTRDGQVTGYGTCGTLNVKKAAAKTNTLPEPYSNMTRYYQNHPMTTKTLKEKWGEPISTHEYDNNITKLTFGPKLSYVGYTYFLTRDGMVIDQNVTGD